MKIKKIMMIVIFIVVMLVSFISNVNATINPEDYKPGDLVVEDYYDAFKFAGVILNAIVVVGLVISVTMCIILGIKYMTGSVEQKAEYKKTMIPMIVGIIMLFTTTTIVGIIYNLVINLNK